MIDEASRVEDELISAVRPMLATTRLGGRLVALSTPAGRRGWFFERWHADDPGWLKIEIPADKCPRIGAEFLEEERREPGPLVFAQE